MRITSTRNPSVRYVRSLDRPEVRRRDRVYLAEGVRLVSEAIATGQHAVLVLYNEEMLRRSPQGKTLMDALDDWPEQALQVDATALEAAAATETPAGVIAVLRRAEPPPLAVHGDASFGVLLDGIADPGNAGTILRTAAAFGVEWIASLAGSVDLFAPKVVRSGMGAHFRLPVYSGVQWREVFGALPHVSLVIADSYRGEPVHSMSWPEHTALVIGSEARGASVEADRRATGRVRIPIKPGVESLNASVAAAIVLYAALGTEFVN